MCPAWQRLSCAVSLNNHSKAQEHIVETCVPGAEQGRNAVYWLPVRRTLPDPTPHAALHPPSASACAQAPTLLTLFPRALHAPAPADLVSPPTWSVWAPVCSLPEVPYLPGRANTCECEPVGKLLGPISGPPFQVKDRNSRTVRLWWH